MQHLRKGRKFSRTRNQRKSLFRTLAFQLIMQERIATSEAKAKEIAPEIEKMITRAKRGGISNHRILRSRLPAAAASKLMNVLGPRFRDRKGGFTRIMKLGPRKSDSSSRALIELIA
jgi:large subunit ribosomal protein L17